MVNLHYNRVKMKKKAQSSVFMVAGISMLILIGVFMLVQQNYTKSNFFSRQYLFSAEQTKLDSFIQECVRRTTIDAET
jgi:uncharacterized integral membrane protein